MIKRLPYIFFIPLAFAALLFSCGRSDTMRGEELEEQKRQWIAQINETFSAYTQDTVELRSRLDHYLETGNKIGQVQTYRILGVQARYASQFRKAIDLHSAGLDVAREIADTVNITILLNDLATDYRRIGAYNEAAPYSYEALQTAEQYRGPDTLPIQRNMASAYNGIGNVYLPMGEQDEAMKAFEKALALDSLQDNHWGIAVNLSNIGSIHFSRKEYALAEAYYRRSMVHNEQANQLVGTALGHINLGELFQAQDRLDDALAEYTLAYDALKESTDQLHWLDACFHIANIYMRQGRLVQAAPYLAEGLQKAREIHSMKHLSRAHQLYSSYNYERGDYRRSVNDLRTVQAYNDTIRRNQESERLMESRVQYEAARHSKEIEELDRINQAQVAKRRATIFMMLPVIVVLFVLLLLLVYKRRLERRQAAEVKSLERMRSNFFTKITHEFRTPITVINGLSEHLRSEIEDSGSPEAKDVDAIRRQGGRLLHLVNQLLDFSRSEAGVDKPRWRHGDIVEFINVIAEPYAQYASRKGIELFVYSEQESLTMNYAPSHLRKIVDNLLYNAIKYSSEGDRIIIHLRHDLAEHKCLIQVRDSGEGIEPENLPHIFELYYTSATGNEGISSSGIGLALTKQLIEQTGGKIDVVSTPGKGSEFTVSLPVSNAPIPKDERETFGDENADAMPNMLQDEEGWKYAEQTVTDDDRKSILVVEDNQDVAHYISTVLGEEYSLLNATDGNEGLRLAEEHIPDLIITDVMMPEKDGYAFTADLRASLATSHIPVIMITAKVTTEDKLEGLKSGADAYLHKPFNERELRVRINQLLESRAMLREKYSQILVSGGTSDERESAETEDRNGKFLSKLSNAITGHLDDENYFYDGLAADMCISVSQLYRKVKAMTGSTVLSFVKEVRLERARLLLSKGGQSIKEVALACGFSDMSYFSRSFKDEYGCTPSQFVKNTEQ